MIAATAPARGGAGHCRQRWAGGRRESDACQARARSAGRLGAGRERWALVPTFLIAARAAAEHRRQAVQAWRPAGARGGRAGKGSV